MCGVVKRYIVNAVRALEIKANSIATAQHADYKLICVFKTLFYRTTASSEDSTLSAVALKELLQQRYNRTRSTRGI